MTSSNFKEEHYCSNVSSFPVKKFHQVGRGLGRNVLLVGESPAPNGWRKSGIACYDSSGKILPTGRRLNELLDKISLSVEICGFTELSKCYIGKNRKQLKECAKKCWPIFLKQIKPYKYKIIIILGVETTKIFSELCEVLFKPGHFEKARINGKTYHILPLYHPSPINPTSRNKNREIFNRLANGLRAVIGRTKLRSAC